jgi:hypothetical protein
MTRFLAFFGRKEYVDALATLSRETWGTLTDGYPIAIIRLVNTDVTSNRIYAASVWFGHSLGVTALIPAMRKFRKKKWR